MGVWPNFPLLLGVDTMNETYDDGFTKGYRDGCNGDKTVSPYPWNHVYSQGYSYGFSCGRASVTKRVRIKCSLGWLDTFDVDYEWTQNKPQAWMMSKQEAAQRLVKIVKIHPDAKIIE